MSPDTGHSGDWGFPAAIDLIRAVDIAPKTAFSDRESFTSFKAPPLLLPPSSPESSQGSSSDGNVSLGNFDSVFSALGLPLKASPSSSAVGSVTSNAELDAQKPWPRKKKAKNNTYRVLSRIQSQSPKHSTGLPPEIKDEDLADVSYAIQINAENVEPVKTTFFPEKARLVHSDGETLRKDDPSQARRDVIQALVGTPPKSSNKKDGISQSTFSSLTPASIKPPKHFRNKSADQTSLPRSSSSERLIALMQMLFERFPEDVQSLSSLYRPSVPVESNGNAMGVKPDGIHVFVDISNILIGLHDTLKVHQGLPKETRIPRQHLSFQKLALILERGRPAAKRVLVGSDQVESTLEAKQIGYDTHILERVTKFKEPTARQKYFQKLDHSSGSDDKPRSSLAVARRVEQGVDELLHLKMSHSLLDTDTPSTIVLATGDAAEAEYSDGFLAMVERALERKWKVELVAFKGNLSRAYTNHEWMSRWGDAFRVIELDQCAELLRLE